jgi:hypothetical protein
MWQQVSKVNMNHTVKILISMSVQQILHELYILQKW